MGQMIVKQPDGKYAVYSTAAESLILRDVTPEQILDWRMTQYQQKARLIIDDIVKALDAGEEPYGPLTMEWEDVQ